MRDWNPNQHMPPARGGEAWFNYLPEKTTLWWLILALPVFTDFLYVPLALVLYLALKSVNRNAMLLATAFIGLLVMLDLAVTWSHYASILILYSKYCTSTSAVQRAAYLSLDLLLPFSLWILVASHGVKHYFPEYVFFRTAIP
jgi:hypothetical protein